MSGRTKWLKSVGVATALSQAALAHAALRPVSPDQFFIPSDRPAVLQWTSVPSEGPATIPCEITDYGGRKVADAESEVNEKGVAQVRITLPPGYYEIEFPRHGQRFGIVVAPEHRGSLDPFFCVDSALSWLEGRADVRTALARILKRSGIGMSRERLTWGAVQPTRDRWDWQTPQRFEELRQAYSSAGLKVLEMSHDAPAWMGRAAGGPYPADLVAAGRSWAAIGRRWQPCWGAMEIWNEPDIFFGGNLPGDQYAPVVNAIASACRQAGLAVPIVAGVFTDGCPDAFRRSCAENGLLDHVDAVSFHTYRTALTVEEMVVLYRAWLSAYGREAMPLWITESGRPWPRGPERPPADKDAVSALDITMKAIEAKACGIAAFFPFVYVYYEENKNNFGMMGKEVTPLRSMAAYVQTVRVLSGRPYLGDLPCGDPAVRRARVFGGQEHAVVVLYTDKASPETSIKLDVTVRRLEGIDGRVLHQAEDRKIPIPDGLTYAWVDPAQIAGKLRSDTTAGRLYAVSRKPAPKPAESSPIVLQYLFDPKSAVASNTGYQIGADEAGPFPVRVRVHNLSDRKEQVGLKLTYTTAQAPINAGPDQTLTVDPLGNGDVNWGVDVQKLGRESDSCTLTVRAERGAAGRISPLSIRVVPESSVQDQLARFTARTQLPIGRLGAWRENVSPNGRMTMTVTPQGHWRVEARFEAGDAWIYPKLRLPEGADLTRTDHVLLRARCEKPASVRLILWETGGAGYLSERPIIRADGRWHTVVVRLRDCTPMESHPDQNGKLDLDLGQVREISIGMNSEGRENSLEISEAWLVGGR
jgi:hypothetical protein